jgi:Na+/H+ antiporter NhaA
MTKEVVEATGPDGVLSPWQRVLPVVAAIGIALVPALIPVSLVGPSTSRCLAKEQIDYGLANSIAAGGRPAANVCR